MHEREVFSAGIAQDEAAFGQLPRQRQRLAVRIWRAEPCEKPAELYPGSDVRTGVLDQPFQLVFIAGEGRGQWGLVLEFVEKLTYKQRDRLPSRLFAVVRRQAAHQAPGPIARRGQRDRRSPSSSRLARGSESRRRPWPWKRDP